MRKVFNFLIFIFCSVLSYTQSILVDSYNCNGDGTYDAVIKISDHDKGLTFSGYEVKSLDGYRIESYYDEALTGASCFVILPFPAPPPTVCGCNGVSYYSEPCANQAGYIALDTTAACNNSQKVTYTIKGIQDEKATIINVYIKVFIDGQEIITGPKEITLNHKCANGVDTDPFKGYSPKSALVGDINNDGWMDVLLDKYIFLNSEMGFKLKDSLSQNIEVGSLVDINQDGYLDLIGGKNAIGDQFIFMNNKNGGFVEDKSKKFNGYPVLQKAVSPDALGEIIASSPSSIQMSSLNDPSCRMYDVKTLECIQNIRTVEEWQCKPFTIFTDYLGLGKLQQLHFDSLIYPGGRTKLVNEFSLPYSYDLLNRGKVDIIEGSPCRVGMYILLNDGSNFVNLEGIDFLNYVLDYNNDGKIDIGARQEIMINKGINNILDFDKISIDQDNIVNFSTILDYDNDGKVDALMIPYKVPNASPRFVKNNSVNPNIRPNKPKNLEVVKITSPENIIRLTWETGGDDRTQYPTFNLYLKNKTTNQVIYAPHSNLVTGKLTKLEKGNMEYLTSWDIIWYLPSGEYEWKVQAVDQGYLGSEWAVGLEFEINTSSCDREIEMAQGVTCIIPKDMQSGQLLYVCENQSGQTLDYTIGKKYKIGYIDHPGCFSTCQQGHKVSVNCLEPINTGVNDFDFHHISIFPNPTDGFFHISSLDLVHKIDLLDLNGKKLEENLNFDQSVDISYFPSSIYLLDIKYKNGKRDKYKIVKM